MKLRYKNYILLLTIILLTGSSCNKFVDINKDPNNPTSAQLALLLPSTEISMAGNLTGIINGTSTIMQHTIASTTLTRYQESGTDFSSSWDGLYSQTLNDIEAIITTGTAQQQWGYVAIAKFEKVYIYSLMVDMWGDIPYSQAELGQQNNAPALEGGAAVYEKLLTLLDDGITDANKITATTLVPGSSDVFYAGTKASWIAMANSLKLKMYNQIRLVDPARSTAAIKTLIAGPLINSNSTDFTFKYGSGTNPVNRHPWHVSEYTSGKNFYQSQSFMDLMFGLDDPRLRYFIFRQNTTSGLNNTTNSNGYYGRNPGDGTGGPADQAVRSTFGIYPAGGLYDNAPINNLPPTNLYLTNTGATGSTKVVTITDGTGAGITPLITYAMVKFIRAEAALALNTGDDARQSLSDAVTANLSSISVYAAANGGIVMPAATITGYVNRLLAQYDATDAAGKLNLVMTQKYIACFGNGMEQYNDYRRTGLPVLRALLSPLNVFPLRLFYSQTELSANTFFATNGSQLQTAQQTTPVFWDK
ncbi:SusD/RagB family nutrient-binding outer membrane lipoprotein [Mucilaginibacter sp.]|uniref:SusD/RagB family nutrient-binding outer membrane lipoprotein n=1 Tax=Mucilaginibacter sp. TaxID=1882438 RepID=UPI00261E2E14|nr:SusD/RagB family nutrient-binding outer membrane lipoprotein [Mucilaginibacter sp.]